MATVTAFSAARMKAIEDACIVNGGVVLDDLILTRNDGTTVNAGNVRGPKGDKGDTGADATAIITEKLPTDPSTAYPVGISIFQFATTAGWPTTYATVMTVRKEANRAYQHVTTGIDGTMWVRAEVNIDTWGDWHKVATAKYVDDKETSLKTTSRLHLKTRLLQQVLTGGGVRKVNSTGVAWTERFIVLGAGRDDLAPSGFFDINMPPDATVVPVYGHETVTSVTVASGRIPLGAWQALYYEAPIGSTHGSEPTRFRIVDYRANMQDIPPNWVFLVIRNGDPMSASYTWGDGREQDFWHPFSLANSWVNYGSGYPGCAWKFGPDGSVHLRGLVKGGTFSTTSPVAQFNAALGADDTSGGGAEIFIQASVSGHARVDLRTDGALLFMAAYNTGGNGWLALTGIKWYPVGH